jgi:hypothetical protein
MRSGLELSTCDIMLFAQKDLDFGAFHFQISRTEMLNLYLFFSLMSLEDGDNDVG